MNILNVLLSNVFYYIYLVEFISRLAVKLLLLSNKYKTVPKPTAPVGLSLLFQLIHAKVSSI